MRVESNKISRNYRLVLRVSAGQASARSSGVLHRDYVTSLGEADRGKAGMYLAKLSHYALMHSLNQ